MSENITIEPVTENNVIISDSARKSFNSIGVLGIIVAILGFIIALFFGYQAVKIYISISEIEEQIGNNPFMSQSNLGVFTKMKIAAGLITTISLVLIATGVMLILFVASIRKSLSMNNQKSFERALKFMRNTFIIVGINSVLILTGTAYYYFNIMQAQGRF